ncbi:MBL fold metallo-hydrolase [Candidatus Collierbacteria bacterium]|nr:MBL fold metallo-hydrolase [Candidatus Collierbacteria bacterium]
MRYWKKAVAIFLLGLVFILKQWPDRNLHIVFCDVGQGDASLVIKNNFQMLIDTGPSEKGVLECLGKNIPFWDRRVEVVINTHPEKDHIGGLREVAKRYKIDTLLINGEINLESISQTKVVRPQDGDRLVYQDLQLDILWPEKQQVQGVKTDLNKNSVVGRLVFGKFDVLFTGDIGSEEERELADRYDLSGIEIVKVAHHGSKFSSDEEMLKEVRPKEAVVMVGKNNSYGHPAKTTLERFARAGSRVWRTDRDGTVKFASDGEKYWVDKVPNLIKRRT